MKNGVEVRKSGSLIHKRLMGIGYNVLFRLCDGSYVMSRGNPWDRLPNARRDADLEYPGNQPDKEAK